jgi:hypothetical protein
MAQSSRRPPPVRTRPPRSNRRPPPVRTRPPRSNRRPPPVRIRPPRSSRRPPPVRTRPPRSSRRPPLLELSLLPLLRPHLLPRIRLLTTDTTDTTDTTNTGGSPSGADITLTTPLRRARPVSNNWKEGQPIHRRKTLQCGRKKDPRASKHARHSPRRAARITRNRAIRTRVASLTTATRRASP